MLERINGINDLKQIPVKDLPVLCKEIRDFLIPLVNANGGHLASNLGVVELTVALCYCFDECDKIVWDVGHQSYVYKLLTGRKNELLTLRTKDGISGFPNPEESDADCFVAGHASTAISAALGFAAARDAQCQQHNCIAVVGDGALTGGLSFEGLNNLTKHKTFVIVNDNGMSINGTLSKATGTFNSLRIGKYDLRKARFKRFTLSIPLIGKGLHKFFGFCKRVAKYGFANNNLYFNSFNIKYIGTLDGNDVGLLIKYFKKIRANVTQSTVIHVKTIKGKGLTEAELNPALYHSVSGNVKSIAPSMSLTAGYTLTELAQTNDKIVAITAAMRDGTGLAPFFERFPDRAYDCGIAEQHCTVFAAALCKGGMRPYFFVYSTFLQRGFDQIIQDVALQNLPVVFCIDRAGFVGSDGKTHQGLFDISYLSLIPNLTVLAPADQSQLIDMLRYSQTATSPVAIRYAKEAFTDFNAHFSKPQWDRLLSGDGKLEIIAEGNRMLTLALNLADKLRQNNIDVNVTNACVIKPLDCHFLNSIKYNAIVTLEENVLNGGLGNAIASYLSPLCGKVLSFGAPDAFVAHATIEQQLEACGLTVDALLPQIISFLTKKG